MPTYIDGEIPVGSVQSGELVLKNVVIETALPYKPPTEGGVRDNQPYICAGDFCRINPDYVPSPDERMILFDASTNQLATVDGTDGMVLIRDGWQFIGAFDPATAESIADKLASDPPVDNKAVQNAIWLERAKALGVIAGGLPLGAIVAIAGREKKLKEETESGRLKPLDPQNAAKNISEAERLGEQGWQNADAIAREINRALNEGAEGAVAGSGRRLSFFRLVSMGRPLNYTEWGRAIGDSGAGWYGWAGASPNNPDSKSSEIKVYVTGYKTGSDVNDVYYISQRILPIVSKELGTEIRVASPTQSYEGSPQFRDFVTGRSATPPPAQMIGGTRPPDYQTSAPAPAPSAPPTAAQPPFDPNFGRIGYVYPDGRIVYR